jgi:uncharacterized protein YlxP (DUF503 family)
VTVGIYTIELYLPMARSLKNKRQVVQKLKHRVRARFNAAVSETAEHAELWQRAGLAFVSVASRQEPLERLFESIHAEAVSQVPGEVIETGTDFIEVAAGDMSGWEDESP